LVGKGYLKGTIRKNKFVNLGSSQIDMKEQTKILLVYNAKSDLFNKLGDFTHKIISPSTYQCDLCSLTHGSIGPRKNWSEFLDKYNKNIIVYYEDQFRKEYDFPVSSLPVIIKKDENLSILMNSTELKKMDTDELIQRLKYEIH
jgi:hypothetical protein